MQFSWDYFIKTFPVIAAKLPVTLSLTVISAGFSLVIGTVMALINYYKVPGLTQFLKAWSSFIRGTPAVTQMFFFYYGLATVSAIILNMSPVVAVAIVMSLNMSAFVAESVRAALISVDEGQKEAAL